jgi:hypothetical protein
LSVSASAFCLASRSPSKVCHVSIWCSRDMYPRTAACKWTASSSSTLWVRVAVRYVAHRLSAKPLPTRQCLHVQSGWRLTAIRHSHHWGM